MVSWDLMDSQGVGGIKCPELMKALYIVHWKHAFKLVAMDMTLNMEMDIDMDLVKKMSKDLLWK